MITLKFYADSSIDNNLSKDKFITQCNLTWGDYLRTFPHVIDAEWVSYDFTDPISYTIITFDSEEHKNWFVLRWS